MTRAFVLPVLLVLLAAACTSESEQVDVAAERNAILAADRAWSETPPDIDRFVSYFTRNGVFLAGGDLGYTVGSYEITSNDPAGNPVTRPGKYVTVWKKQADGQWKVAVDAPSENQPPQAPTASFELAQDSVELDPQHYQVVFENDQVRILRITYGPNEKSVMHEHPAGVAVFLSDDQRWRFTASDGTTEEETRKIGEAIWTEAGKHLPENLTDQTHDVILVELKTNP